MKRLVLSVFVLTSLFGVLGAAPFQTLGMLRTPDAYVLPHKAAEILLVGYYRDVAKPDYVDPAMNKKVIPYGMLAVGLGDRAEIGFFGGDKVYYFNAKLKLIQETLRIPQVSIGVDNMFSPVNHSRAQDYNPSNSNWAYADHPDKTDYEYWSPYIVGSKQVVIGGVNWMFNLGAGSNRFIGQVRRSRIFNGIFYSVELSPLKNLYLQGEYSGHDFQAGVKYSIGNFGIRVGAQAIEDLAKNNGYEDNLRVAVGLSYLFDKYATAKRRPDLKELAKVDDNLIIVEPDVVEPVTPVTPGTDVAVVEPVTPGTDITVVGPVTPGTPGTDVAVVEPVTPVTPGTGETVTGEVSLSGLEFTTGDVAVQPGLYKELSPEIKDLMSELRLLREEREKAQKALVDLRKWLDDQKK